MLKNILILVDMPSEGGSILSNSAGVEWTKLINECGIDRQEITIKSVLPSYDPFLDGKIDLGAKADGVVINGHKITKGLANAIGTFLHNLPPDPNRLIFGMGKLPLLMLAGETSDFQYRGSMFSTKWGKFFPTISPDMWIKVWEWRHVSKMDYQKGLRYQAVPIKVPVYNFIINPTFEIVEHTLANLLGDLCLGEPIKIAVDIETWRKQQISVIGLAWSEVDSLVIPILDFLSPNYSRFTPDEEYLIIKMLNDILTHPNARICGQNFHYDKSYFAKLYGINVRMDYDAMHMFHCLYPGELKKSLDFLSSIICDYHVYWKDEGKEIHDAIKTHDMQMEYWTYNAKDCVTTWEICDKLERVLDMKGLTHVWDFQRTMAPELFKTMTRGIRYDKERRLELVFQFGELQTHYEAFFERVVPSLQYFPQKGKTKSAPWYSSPTKTKALLYDMLGLPIQLNKKTKQPSTDDDSLRKLIKYEPLIAPLLIKLLGYRSLGVFISNFLSAGVDVCDGRMHTFYNLSGAETFRLSAKQDPFGTGANLQNVPKGDEK